MVESKGDVPEWLQAESDNDLPDGESVSLGLDSTGRQYRDYTRPRRVWCRRCAPFLICLGIAGLGAGLAVYFTGKSPAQLADEAEDLAEEYVPSFGGDKDEEPEKEEYSDEPTEFTFFSPFFDDGGGLPDKYTSSGDGLSPPLSWTNIPNGTVSLALIFDEPADESGAEGGGAPEPYTHWVAYDIPIDAVGLQEGLPNVERVELDRIDTEEGNGGSDIFMLQGLNSWGDEQYDGADDGDAPMGAFGYHAPETDEDGKIRMFYFRLYALKEKLPLEPKFATRDEVLKKANAVGILGSLTLQVSY